MRFQLAGLLLLVSSVQSHAEVSILKAGFSDQDLNTRVEIQCILHQADLYDSVIDGLYVPETEDALLAAYARIGSERVNQARGGLNTEREVYYFLLGFTDAHWGYESFSDERAYCSRVSLEQSERRPEGRASVLLFFWRSRMTRWCFAATSKEHAE